MTTWDSIKTFVNNSNRNESFTKKDIRAEFNFGGSGTVHCYINYLRQAGFLTRIKPGVYKRVIPIPVNLSLSGLIVMAYKDKTKVTQLIRKFKIEKIENEKN